jgi:L-2-hydroxyglutarate oxidase LhgO
MRSYDVCIVGAGVVGCAIAREFAHRRWDHPIRIVVLEAHGGAGQETSSRNSGVLHSGIHEHPASLKGRLAREGSALAVAYAIRHRIPLLTTGMVIAISWEDVRQGLWRETSSLWRLWRNARQARIRTSVLSPSGLRRWEPNLRAACGISIPSVAVIDSTAFVQTLRAEAEAAGVQFAFDNRVIDIESDSGFYRVTTSQQGLHATCLINAAGLYADEVASLAIPQKPYALAPLRGEYYEIVTASTKRLIGRLVYPALPPGSVGKGIHFSPRPNGQMFLGPNALPVRSKTDYTSHKTPPELFVQAVHKFLPALEEHDLRWAYSGIRPQLLTSHGGKGDFVIAADCEDPPLINLIGIESPGLSAALAIARHVTNLPCVQQRFLRSHGSDRPPHETFVQRR